MIGASEKKLQHLTGEQTGSLANKLSSQVLKHHCDRSLRHPGSSEEQTAQRKGFCVISWFAQQEDPSLYSREVSASVYQQRMNAEPLMLKNLWKLMKLPTPSKSNVTSDLRDIFCVWLRAVIKPPGAMWKLEWFYKAPSRCWRGPWNGNVPTAELVDRERQRL